MESNDVTHTIFGTSFNSYYYQKTHLQASYPSDHAITDKVSQIDKTWTDIWSSSRPQDMCVSSLLLQSIVFIVSKILKSWYSTRVGTLIVATIYLQLTQNRYMFRSFTVLQCSHQHCVQPVASDVEVVGYL